jgi:YARHG domain
MSRRSIALVAVFLGALLVANIFVLAIWLPGRRTSEAKTQLAKSPPAASPVASISSAATTPADATATAGAINPAERASDFALERQITSRSGNIRINYFRNPKTKMRRVTVEDMHRPGASTVVSDSKRAVWILVSPDDQWIAVNERDAVAGSGVRLYRRQSDSSGRYVPVEGTEQGHSVQDMVWHAYADTTHAAPNTRRAVTVDAANWEDDSRKLNLSVAYLPTRENPDVPEPWSCSYDVISKQVEPIPGQPQAGADTAAANQDEQSGQEQGSRHEVAAASPPGASEGDANMATTDDDAELPGEKFPATRFDELTVSDVNESSLSEVTYAINEMYARHGAEFKDKKVTQQFSQFSWYKPQPGVTLDEAENQFSDLEKQNLKVLQRCRDAKIAATHRKSRPAHTENAEEETTGQKILRGIKAWQDAGAPLPPHP